MAFRGIFFLQVARFEKKMSFTRMGLSVTILAKPTRQVNVLSVPPIPILLEETSEHTPVLRECGEPLIPLSTLTPRIAVYSVYYHQGYEGAQPEIYLREGAAHRLAAAAETLPSAYHLVVLDGWRSHQVQASLYERFRQSLLAQGWQEGEELAAELSKFVAKPTTDISNPSPHLSGGAVDLTIAGTDGWLDMGTPFDDFSELAATRYFEEMPVLTERERIIRENRRLLYHLMTEAGFVNYPEEWWHYEYGTRSWARATGRDAMYGGILSVFHPDRS